MTLDVFTGVQNPVRVEGLATFDKKVILFGSEGKAKIFTTKFVNDDVDDQLMPKTNLPKAVVEVVDPICLAAQIAERHHHHHHCNANGEEAGIGSLPECVCRCFDDTLSDTAGDRVVLVSIGIFTIVKLERKVQLLIPAFDFCFPENECIEATAENPCELFDRLRFPIDEFFPPQIQDFEGAELFERRERCRD